METNEKIIAIVGLTEAIKQYGIPSQFCATVAIIIGAIIGYIENPTSQGIFEGVVLGATVTGGYAITKKTGKSILSPFNTKKSFNPVITDYSRLEPDDDRGV